MKHEISKTTEIVAPNGIPDFEIMATPLANINIPKNVTAPVAKDVQN